MSKRPCSINPLTKKLFSSIFLTMVFAELGLLISVMVDGVIISSLLGSENMAAHGLLAPYFSAVAGITGVFASGARIRCANALGKTILKRRMPSSRHLSGF